MPEKSHVKLPDGRLAEVVYTGRSLDGQIYALLRADGYTQLYEPAEGAFSLTCNHDLPDFHHEDGDWLLFLPEINYSFCKPESGLPYIAPRSTGEPIQLTWCDPADFDWYFAEESDSLLFEEKTRLLKKSEVLSLIDLLEQFSIRLSTVFPWVVAETAAEQYFKLVGQIGEQLERIDRKKMTSYHPEAVRVSSYALNAALRYYRALSQFDHLTTMERANEPGYHHTALRLQACIANLLWMACTSPRSELPLPD